MLIHADGAVEARFTGGVGPLAAPAHAVCGAASMQRMLRGLHRSSLVDWPCALLLRMLTWCSTCPHPPHPPLVPRSVALPARGRTVLGQWASTILLQNLPRWVTMHTAWSLPAGGAACSLAHPSCYMVARAPSMLAPPTPFIAHSCAQVRARGPAVPPAGPARAAGARGVRGGHAGEFSS